MIGEYWHLGYLNRIYDLDINRDGKKEIIACGINDANDTISGEFPALAILDPAKIVGKTKSSATPGYRLPLSDAEQYYIRFPVSDLAVAIGVTTNVYSMNIEDLSKLRFDVAGGFLPQRFFFTFYFSFDMKILYVKSGNLTDRVHEQFVKEGKLKGKIDQLYLDNLKNGVQYWDGKKWHKERTMVKHELE